MMNQCYSLLTLSALTLAYEIYRSGTWAWRNRYFRQTGNGSMRNANAPWANTYPRADLVGSMADGLGLAYVKEKSRVKYVKTMLFRTVLQLPVLACGAGGGRPKLRSICANRHTVPDRNMLIIHSAAARGDWWRDAFCNEKLTQSSQPYRSPTRSVRYAVGLGITYQLNK